MSTTIFNKIIIAVAATAIPAIAIAQEAVDSIPTHELNEVVVQAPKVIRKADMDVYYPSRSAIENSRNGMQLLTNLLSSFVKRWEYAF